MDPGEGLKTSSNPTQPVTKHVRELTINLSLSCKLYEADSLFVSVSILKIAYVHVQIFTNLQPNH